MPFALQKVPATLLSCEMHGKRAKRSAGEHAAPTREKKIRLHLDVTDGFYARVLEECWPGSDGVIKAMSGADSPAQDMVCRRKLGDLVVKVYGRDGDSEVFAISVARSKGAPTLRIGKGGKTVAMTMTVVGPVGRDRLATIEDYIEADVYVDVATNQTDIEDAIKDVEGEEGEAGTALSKPKRTARRAAKASVYVGGELPALDVA